MNTYASTQEHPDVSIEKDESLNVPEGVPSVSWVSTLQPAHSFSCFLTDHCLTPFFPTNEIKISVTVHLCKPCGTECLHTQQFSLCKSSFTVQNGLNQVPERTSLSGCYCLYLPRGAVEWPYGAFPTGTTRLGSIRFRYQGIIFYYKRVL